MKSACLLLLAVAGASAFTACPPSLSPARHRSCAFTSSWMSASPGGKDPNEGEESRKTMQRPAADNIITSLIYTVEMARVKLMSEKPSEGNGYWEGKLPPPLSLPCLPLPH